MGKNTDPKALRESPALGDARDQLNLVLGFFSRVDGKQSVLLGIHVAMLGYLASRAPPPSLATWPGWGAGALFVLLTALSMWRLYQGSFPNLDGGANSLVFFRAIATLREIDFIQRYRAGSDEAMTQEVLAQVWRNSVILHDKFQKLRASWRLMACSIVPWLVAIVFFRAEGATLVIGSR